MTFHIPSILCCCSVGICLPSGLNCLFCCIWFVATRFALLFVQASQFVNFDLVERPLFYHAFHSPIPTYLSLHIPHHSPTVQSSTRILITSSSLSIVNSFPLSLDIANAQEIVFLICDDLISNVNFQFTKWRQTSRPFKFLLASF